MWMMSSPAAQARVPGVVGRSDPTAVVVGDTGWIGLDVVGDLQQLCVASALWLADYLQFFFPP